MSFDYYERSNHAGVPISFYEFSIQNLVWRYTSSDDDETWNGNVYSSAAISDSGTVQSGSVEDESFTIALPATLPVVALFAIPPSSPVNVVLRRKQLYDSEAPIFWVGTIQSVRISDPGTGEIICKSAMSTLGRSGLRMAFGRGCPHALYDFNCKVNPGDYSHSLHIEALTGTTLLSSQVGALGDDRLSGGYIEWTRTDFMLVERRPIELHTGSTLSILGVTDGLSVGMWVTAYVGCNRTIDMCNSRFDNIGNFGGFPHLPGKNPFDGNPIF